MPAQPERRFPSRAWLLAVLAAGMIFAGRSALVFYAGSPVPFHDQWIAEATHLLVQDAEHQLTWHNFFIPHGDHLIVSTRLIAYALYRLTGHWDMLAEMLVNNALIAAAFGFLLHEVLRRHASSGIALGGLVVVIWLSSPLFYGNSIWGFQSQIELLVLTAILQIVATSRLESFDRWWWLATVAAIVGVLSFGSGLLAPLTALLICVVRARTPTGSRPALIGAAAVNLAVLAAGGLELLRSPTLNAGRVEPANLLHTAFHAFSWPAMQPALFGWMLWLPALAATFLCFRRHSTLWLVSCGLALWTALQIASIAYTRSLPVPALAPRYYDIFAVGVIANALLCLGFVTGVKAPRGLRALVISLAVLWCGWVGLKGGEFARSHTIYDVPALRNQAMGQIGVVTRYYSGEGRAALDSARFPVLPYPEPAYLDNLLANPAIKAALPDEIARPEPGGLKPDLIKYHWPEGGWVRAKWLRLSLAVLCATALGYCVVALWRREGRPESTPVQPTQEMA
jgi:hypothetical protein